MESCWQLDPAGRPQAKQFRIVILAVAMALVAHHGLAQTSSSQNATRIEALFAQKQWERLVREAESSAEHNPEIEYDYGSALAHLDRWDAARAAFLAGHRLAPKDARFQVELGGVAFKQKRYREAVRWLHAALCLDPKDEYTNDFLATIYFVEGNTEAALKFWNRVAKPHLENVDVQPGLKID